MQYLKTFILTSCLTYTLGEHILFAASQQSKLTSTIQKIIPKASSGSGKITYLSIAQEIQEWMFILVGVIAVLYIIWAGAKLLWAPGNTEEITSAMKTLGYIMLGLAIIPFAWMLVNFIINFSL